MNKTDAALNSLRLRIKGAEANLDKWGKWFLEHPHDALRWSDETFTTAAQFKVFTQVAEALAELSTNSTNSYEKITDYVRREVVRGARWPHKSTSVSADMIMSRTTQAWADVLDLLDGSVL